VKQHWNRHFNWRYLSVYQLTNLALWQSSCSTSCKTWCPCSRRSHIHRCSSAKQFCFMPKIYPWKRSDSLEFWWSLGTKMVYWYHSKRLLTLISFFSCLWFKQAFP